MYLYSCKIWPYWVVKCVLGLCGIAVTNSCLKMVSANGTLELCQTHSHHHDGEPQGAPSREKVNGRWGE